MAVIRDNTNKEDHSIGLIAVSSWQGRLRHKPKKIQEKDFEYEQPGDNASNVSRLWETFTLASPKSAFGYVINGHTALMARVNGQLTAVVGFNPESYLQAAVLKKFKGNAILVRGLWYDDMAMIHDPTAISYEIRVARDEAESFNKLIGKLIGRSDLGESSPKKFPTFYSFRPASTETDATIVGNCGNMAFLILYQYLSELKFYREVSALRHWIGRNESTRNYGQGPMMEGITKQFEYKPKL